MAHQRKRQIEALLEKRVKSQPVVILGGARQVGKSFLVREILKNKFPGLKYATLDNAQTLDFARRNPSTFVSQSGKDQLLVIDEAQKAPAIFDSVKELVDADRRPSQFVLLGSTEFSHRTKVRESLTGRASYLRLFPFGVAESQHLSLRTSLVSSESRASRSEVMRYLERGGMPGIFAVREDDARLGFFEDLIQTTVDRDLLLIAGRAEVDPTIARRVLGLVATLPETSDADIAKAARLSTKAVQKYLALLKLLFVVVEVPTCSESTGRSQHYVCDVGVANALGAPFLNRLRTWVLLELQTYAEYSGQKFGTQIETYRGPKGGRLDFIVKEKSGKQTAILVLDSERIVQQDTEILRSFSQRSSGTVPIALAPVNSEVMMNDVLVLPLERIV